MFIIERIMALRSSDCDEGRLMCARAWDSDLRQQPNWLSPHGTVRVIPGVSVSCAGRVWTWGQACWDLAWSPDAEEEEEPYLVWLLNEEESPEPSEGLPHHSCEEAA